MFGYTISFETSEKKFYEVCQLLESRFEAEKIKKLKLLEDVDGSLIQVYIVTNKKIKVVNDYDVDAVYIDSEIDLSKIMNGRIVYEYLK